MDLRVTCLGIYALLASVATGETEPGRCSKQVSRMVSYTQTFKTSSTQTYYTKCGFLNWSRCTRSRIVYATSTRQAHRVGYVTGYECCRGWQEQAGDCVTTRAPTTKTSISTQMTRRMNESLTTAAPPSTTHNPEQRPHSESSSAGHPDDLLSEATTTILGSEMSENLPSTKDDAGLPAFLQNQTMMVSISVVVVVIFLVMVISGIACGVKKFRRKKTNNAVRLEQQSLSSSQNGGLQQNRSYFAGAALICTRPKPRTGATGKPRGMHKNMTAATNPGYDRIPLDKLAQESSYEVIRSSDGSLKHRDISPTINGAACFEKTALYEDDQATTENEYIALDNELKAPRIPIGKDLPHKDNGYSGQDSKPLLDRKSPLLKPKPQAKREYTPSERNAVQRATPPPAASRHLLITPELKARQYLDMSRSKQKPDSGTKVLKLPSIEKVRSSPLVPKKPHATNGAIHASRSSTELDIVKACGPAATNDIYDFVGADSDNSLSQGRDMMTMTSSEVEYVQPGSASPALNKRTNAGRIDNVTCTYMVGDEAVSPLWKGSSDAPTIPESNEFERKDSELVPNNHYDTVITRNERRNGNDDAHSTPKLGYDIPRQDSSDTNNTYENQGRSSASLSHNAKQSLPLSQYPHDDVYDVVEVNDCRSKTCDIRPKVVPKVAPKKQSSTGGKPCQKSMTAIQRSQSGPSLLRHDEFDSVYVNTSRF